MVITFLLSHFAFIFVFLIDHSQEIMGKLVLGSYMRFVCVFRSWVTPLCCSYCGMMEKISFWTQISSFSPPPSQSSPFGSMEVRKDYIIFNPMFNEFDCGYMSTGCIFNSIFMLTMKDFELKFIWKTFCSKNMSLQTCGA